METAKPLYVKTTVKFSQMAYIYRVSPSKRMPAVVEPSTTRDLIDLGKDVTVSPTKGRTCYVLSSFQIIIGDATVNPVLRGHSRETELK